MGPINLSKEERDAIQKQHQSATKRHNDRKEELKKGLQSLKKEKDEKTTE